MNVMEEDFYKAEALKSCIDFCMKKAIIHQQKAHCANSKEQYRESQRWLIECQRAQRDLDELFKKKEEFDQAQMILKTAESRILRRVDHADKN